MTDTPTAPQIEIYTTPICGFCMRAKSLLDHKGIAYDEFNVMMNAGLRQEMMDRSGGAHTVPQIFINGEHVGGCNELLLLEHQGALDAKLGLT